VPTTKRTRKKTEAELLDQATAQLMRAVKAKATKNGKPLQKSELLKQGYSERFMAQLEEA
jgi:hypothetical protein